MNAQHAPLAPSSAPIWGFCSGSVVASMSVPNVESQESREGTAAHWVGLDQCLTAWKQSDGGAPSCSQWIGQTAPNGVVIDEKMAEGAQILVDDVLAVCQEHGALQALRLEHRVHMPQIHEQNWGTLDVAIPLLDRYLVYVCDYKHGYGEVSAKGNLQLIDYMAGLYNELQIDGTMDELITVVFRVVQPFCYSKSGPVDEWRVKLSDLRGYFNQLNAKAHDAYLNPTFTAGAHCRRCPAVGRCATARRFGYSVLRHVNEPYLIDTMDVHDLAIEREMLLSAAAGLKGRIEAIEDDLKHRIKAGETGSGLAIEATQGRLNWKVPPEQAIIICRQFGIDAASPAARTPTQCAQAASKEMKPAFKEVLKTLAHRETTGLKLVNAEDSIVARAFKRK